MKLQIDIRGSLTIEKEDLGDIGEVLAKINAAYKPLDAEFAALGGALTLRMGDAARVRDETPKPRGNTVGWRQRKAEREAAKSKGDGPVFPPATAA